VCAVLDLGHQRILFHSRRRISNQSCSSEGGTTAEELPKDSKWPIIRSKPDVRPGQPQTNKRKCGIHNDS
jgi:hypothetical protein